MCDIGESFTPTRTGRMGYPGKKRHHCTPTRLLPNYETIFQAVRTENSARFENAEVTIIRGMMVASTMNSVLVALFALSASSFRARAALQVQNVHGFAAAGWEDDEKRAPVEKIVVFDEAQRAWDADRNRRKFKRDISEPNMLLEIMNRHQDWCVMVALVGGGQEIHDGEAGLTEWGGRCWVNSQTGMCMRPLRRWLAVPRLRADLFSLNAKDLQTRTRSTCSTLESPHVPTVLS